MEEYNTIIIGSGIAGLSSSIYLNRAGIKPLIIESSIPGGELTKIDKIENYPGFSEISGLELTQNLLSQTEKYNQEFLYEEVISTDLDRKIIKTESKEIKYRNLIIATGRKSKKLNLENENNYIGKGISFCATCDGMLYKDKEVIVVGGANSAISEALYLSNICKKVTIIYRNSNLRGEKILKDRLTKKNNIEIIYNQEITKYLYDDNSITGCILDNGKRISTNCIFLAIGHIPNSEIFNVEKENGYIIVDNKNKTSKKDVYACGDVIKKDIYQLITSASEGVIAANSIIAKQEESR